MVAASALWGGDRRGPGTAAPAGAGVLALERCSAGDRGGPGPEEFPGRTRGWTGSVAGEAYPSVGEEFLARTSSTSSAK